MQRIFTLAKLIALSALIMGGLYVLFGGSLNGVKNYFWENMSSGASHFVSPDDSNPLKTNGISASGAQLNEVVPNWQSLAGIGLLLAFC